MKNPKITLIIIYNNQTNINEKFIDVLINQTFDDFEAIFVNNSAADNIQELITNACERDERLKQINLPLNEDYNFARQAGIGVASGDFICFLPPDEKTNENFLKNLYSEKLKTYNGNNLFSENKLYKRNFVENNSEIEELVQYKVNCETEKIKVQLSEIEKQLKEALNESSKNCENSIDNKIYETTLRFNSLEKLFYDFENKTAQNIDNKLKESENFLKENNNHIYNDISKVYEYINSENNKKGCEINKVYEEITKNYRYTEDINENIKKEILNEINKIYTTIDALKQDYETKYNSIKHLIEITNNETLNRIKAISILSNTDAINTVEYTANILDLERNVKSSFDEIYSYINKNNEKFYEELSALYKELNNKIIK